MSATIPCVFESPALTEVQAESLNLPPGGEEGGRSGVLLQAGSIRERSIPELLNALCREGCDGVLLLDHGKKRKAVEWRGGSPVAVKSNLIRECFGDFLLAEGRVRPQDLDESVQRMRAGEGLQGEVLVAMEVLDEKERVAALQDHAREKFFELFGWRDGHFEVHRGARLERGSHLGPEGHPSRLILEGVTRRAPMRQIDRYLRLHEEERVVLKDYAEAEPFELGLSIRARAWLEALKENQTLGALLDEPEWIRRLVFGLVSIGFLAVESSSRNAEGVALPAGAPSAIPLVSIGAEEEVLAAELPAWGERTSEGDVYDALDLPESVEDEACRALLAETEFQKGEAKLAARDYPGALRCFGRAMEGYPTAGEYRSYYGWCLHLCYPDNALMRGEALEHCREGVALAKDREKPYLLLGRLYRASGKAGAARKMFSSALQIKPQCIEAMRELRVMNMRRDKASTLSKGVLRRIFRE